jgi:hypothetical protein
MTLTSLSHLAAIHKGQFAANGSRAGDVGNGS